MSEVRFRVVEHLYNHLVAEILLPESSVYIADIIVAMEQMADAFGYEWRRDVNDKWYLSPKRKEV